MVTKDLFWLDGDEYKRRIADYDDKRLLKQEIVKTRQGFAAQASITSGFTLAFFTMGSSALLIGYEIRRRDVAKKKLELIQLELQRRGIDLHELQKRDVLIPLALHVTGMFVGMGLHDLATAVGNSLSYMNFPSGSVPNNADLVGGFTEGVQQQIHGMVVATQSIPNGGLYDASNHVAEHAANAVAQSPSGPSALAFAAGMATAASVEKMGALEVTRNVLEIIFSYDRAIKRSHCPRKMGNVASTSCHACSVVIEAGMYWHCCRCDDDLELCLSCYDQGGRCNDEKHKMRKLQYAVSSEKPSVAGLLPLSKARLRESVTRSYMKQGGFPPRICSSCQTGVLQGRMYHCQTCVLDICEYCFWLSKSCRDESHSLVAVLCAVDCSANPGWVSSSPSPLP